MLIDIATEKLIMWAYDKVELLDMHKAMKLLAIYEELSIITVIDLESELSLIISKDFLKRALVGYRIFDDT